MRRAKDMTGFETEHARVIGRASSQGSRAMWALECICGAVFRATGTDIRRRPSMSCGCRGKLRLAKGRSVSDNVCVIARCGNKPLWRGLCRACYAHARARGVLEKVALAPKPNGFVGATREAHPRFANAQTEAERGYQRMHRRLEAKYGRAARHACAEQCGRAAVHWSYDGYCSGEKFGNAALDAKPWCPHLDHYQPRCIDCHNGWDADSDYVAHLNEEDGDA